MNYPANFTKGDVDDITFRKAFEAAFTKKSRLTILQTLKHAGVPVERAEEYADQFLKEGKLARKKLNRPHIILGWLAILIGIGATIALYATGWVASITFIVILAGIYWLFSHRD